MRGSEDLLAWLFSFACLIYILRSIKQVLLPAGGFWRSPFVIFSAGALSAVACIVTIAVLCVRILTERVRPKDESHESAVAAANKGEGRQRRSFLLRRRHVVNGAAPAPQLVSTHPAAVQQGSFAGPVWLVPSTLWTREELLRQWPPPTHGPAAIAYKFHATLVGSETASGAALLLVPERTDDKAQKIGLVGGGPGGYLLMSLEGVSVDLLRDVRRSPWTKRCPIQLQHPSRPLLRGENTVYMFAESGSAKEQWYAALTAAEAPGGMLADTQHLYDAYCRYMASLQLVQGPPMPPMPPAPRRLWPLSRANRAAAPQQQKHQLQEQPSRQKQQKQQQDARGEASKGAAAPAHQPAGKPPLAPKGQSEPSAAGAPRQRGGRNPFGFILSRLGRGAARGGDAGRNAGPAAGSASHAPSLAVSSSGTTPRQLSQASLLAGQDGQGQGQEGQMHQQQESGRAAAAPSPSASAKQLAVAVDPDRDYEAASDIFAASTPFSPGAVADAAAGQDLATVAAGGGGGGGVAAGDGGDMSGVGSDDGGGGGVGGGGGGGHSGGYDAKLTPEAQGNTDSRGRGEVRMMIGPDHGTGAAEAADHNTAPMTQPLLSEDGEAAAAQPGGRVDGNPADPPVQPLMPSPPPLPPPAHTSASSSVSSGRTLRGLAEASSAAVTPTAAPPLPPQPPHPPPGMGSRVATALGPAAAGHHDAPPSSRPRLPLPLSAEVSSSGSEGGQPRRTPLSFAEWSRSQPQAAAAMARMAGAGEGRHQSPLGAAARAVAASGSSAAASAAAAAAAAAGDDSGCPSTAQPRPMAAAAVPERIQEEAHAEEAAAAAEEEAEAGSRPLGSGPLPPLPPPHQQAPAPPAVTTSPALPPSSLSPSLALQPRHSSSMPDLFGFAHRMELEQECLAAGAGAWAVSGSGPGTSALALGQGQRQGQEQAGLGLSRLQLQGELAADPDAAAPSSCEAAGERLGRRSLDQHLTASLGTHHHHPMYLEPESHNPAQQHLAGKQHQHRHTHSLPGGDLAAVLVGQQQQQQQQQRLGGGSVGGAMGERKSGGGGAEGGSGMPRTLSKQDLKRLQREEQERVKQEQQRAKAAARAAEEARKAGERAAEEARRAEERAARERARVEAQQRRQEEEAKSRQARERARSARQLGSAKSLVDLAAAGTARSTPGTVGDGTGTPGTAALSPPASPAPPHSNPVAPQGSQPRGSDMGKVPAQEPSMPLPAPSAPPPGALVEGLHGLNMLLVRIGFELLRRRGFEAWLHRLIQTRLDAARRPGFLEPITLQRFDLGYTAPQLRDLRAVAGPNNYGPGTATWPQLALQVVWVGNANATIATKIDFDQAERAGPDAPGPTTAPAGAATAASSPPPATAPGSSVADARDASCTTPLGTARAAAKEAAPTGTGTHSTDAGTAAASVVAARDQYGPTASPTAGQAAASGGKGGDDPCGKDTHKERCPPPDSDFQKAAATPGGASSASTGDAVAAMATAREAVAAQAGGVQALACPACGGVTSSGVATQGAATTGTADTATVPWSVVTPATAGDPHAPRTGGGADGLPRDSGREKAPPAAAAHDEPGGSHSTANTGGAAVTSDGKRGRGSGGSAKEGAGSGHCGEGAGGADQGGRGGSAGTGPSKDAGGAADKGGGKSWWNYVPIFSLLRKAGQALASNLAGQLTGTPVEVHVQATRFEGTLLLWLAPPPSDRLWLSFAEPPRMDFTVTPVLGSRKLSGGLVVGRLSAWVRSKVTAGLSRAMVYPACVDVRLGKLLLSIDSPGDAVRPFVPPPPLPVPLMPHVPQAPPPPPPMTPPQPGPAPWATQGPQPQAAYGYRSNPDVRVSEQYPPAGPVGANGRSSERPTRGPAPTTATNPLHNTLLAPAVGGTALPGRPSLAPPLPPLPPLAPPPPPAALFGAGGPLTPSVAAASAFATAAIGLSSSSGSNLLESALAHVFRRTSSILGSSPGSLSPLNGLSEAGSDDDDHEEEDGGGEGGGREGEGEGYYYNQGAEGGSRRESQQGRTGLSPPPGRGQAYGGGEYGPYGPYTGGKDGVPPPPPPYYYFEGSTGGGGGGSAGVVDASAFWTYGPGEEGAPLGAAWGAAAAAAAGVGAGAGAAQGPGAEPQGRGFRSSVASTASLPALQQHTLPAKAPLQPPQPEEPAGARRGGRGPLGWVRGAGALVARGVVAAGGVGVRGLGAVGSALGQAVLGPVVNAGERAAMQHHLHQAHMPHGLPSPSPQPQPQFQPQPPQDGVQEGVAKKGRGQGQSS